MRNKKIIDIKSCDSSSNICKYGKKVQNYSDELKHNDNKKSVKELEMHIDLKSSCCEEFRNLLKNLRKPTILLNFKVCPFCEIKINNKKENIMGKGQFKKEELENKYFKLNSEEWVVTEVLLYGYKCNCRSLNTDSEKIFNCSFVDKSIKSKNYNLEG